MIIYRCLAIHQKGQKVVTLPDDHAPKAFLDELRCRNGNLNITCGREATKDAL